MTNTKPAANLLIELGQAQAAFLKIALTTDSPMESFLYRRLTELIPHWMEQLDDVLGRTVGEANPELLQSLHGKEGET